MNSCLQKYLYVGKTVAKLQQLESIAIWSDKRFNVRETCVKLRKFYLITLLFLRIKRRAPLLYFMAELGE
jgi:hypothetical protein